MTPHTHWANPTEFLSSLIDNFPNYVIYEWSLCKIFIMTNVSVDYFMKRMDLTTWIQLCRFQQHGLATALFYNNVAMTLLYWLPPSINTICSMKTPGWRHGVKTNWPPNLSGTMLLNTLNWGQPPRFQATSLKAMKLRPFLLKLHWSLFSMFQLNIIQATGLDA